MAIKITKNGTAGAQDRAPAAKTYQEGSSQGKTSGRIKITKIERPQTAAKPTQTIPVEGTTSNVEPSMGNSSAGSQTARSSLPAERGSKHKSGKEISQSIVRNEDAAKRIGATVRGTAQNLGANASGFLAALVAAAEEMDKEYRDAKEKAGVTTHADEMNPYPKTNEEITRGNRAGIDLLEGIADTQRAKAAENIRTAKEGLGTAGKVGIDAFQIGMNLAGIVGANAILPGLGTAALGVSSGGSMANDYRKAQGENYNPLAGAGLAIGGAASVGIGGAAAKGAIRYGGALLNKLGLGNSAIAQNVLGALSDIAFAGGMSATNEYAKAAAYGDSYWDGAVVMLPLRETEDGHAERPLMFLLTGEPAHDSHSGPVPGHLTLHQIMGLPDTLLARCMTHELLTDKEVREIIRSGRVSAENYLDILLWYLAGNYETHYLGMAGIDAEGCCADLIFHHLTPQAEHFQFYLEEIPQF